MFTLKLLNTSSKFLTMIMFIIVKVFVGIIMCLLTSFHMHSSSGSVYIAIKFKLNV
jgi:hypothetical protein